LSEYDDYTYDLESILTKKKEEPSKLIITIKGLGKEVTYYIVPDLIKEAENLIDAFIVGNEKIMHCKKVIK